MLIKASTFLIFMPDIKRQTAYKCTISQLNNGKYVVQQGWDPNYIEIGNLKVSRVNLMVTLLSKDGNVLMTDDGTGKIEIRLFTDQERADNLNVGDVILVIGRPREYQNKRYVVPEILRKIENKKWIKHRRKELDSFSLKLPEPEEKQPEPEPVQETLKPNFSFKIIETIKKLDKGSGADKEAVIKECGVEKAEEQIEILLNEGEIFEIRAGMLKVLE